MLGGKRVGRICSGCELPRKLAERLHEEMEPWFCSIECEIDFDVYLQGRGLKLLVGSDRRTA